VQSTISIVKKDGEYLFRWGLKSTDATWKVRCGWDGMCQEFVDGEKTSEYGFRIWVDEESGRLRIECTGKVSKPSEMDVHYIDELMLGRDRLRLRALTLERDGTKYEGPEKPTRVFVKLSDYVDDPPSGIDPLGPLSP